MTRLATRTGCCELDLAMGAKRPKHCEHGCRYLTEAQLNPKPRKPLNRTTKGRRGSTLKRGRGFAVTKAQREKVRGLPCVGCGREASEYVAIDPAHIWSEGCRCTDPLCIIPLCRTFQDGCHVPYDRRELDLPTPQLGWVDVPGDLAELVAAYRFHCDVARNGGEQTWADLDELTQGRRKYSARKDLERIYPALEAYFDPPYKDKSLRSLGRLLRGERFPLQSTERRDR